MILGHIELPRSGLLEPAVGAYADNARRFGQHQFRRGSPVTLELQNKMEIKSSHSGTVLRFSENDGDYFYVSIENPIFSGTVKAWAYTDAHGLVRLFDSLSKDWKGWNGERKWETIEGEFKISCTHDGLGHIKMSVVIHQDYGSDEPWKLNAGLIVDAIQLEQIAKDASELFKQ